MTWLSELVGQYRRRYLRQIAAENRIWSARGPRSQGSFALRLEKIYVDLRVAPSTVKRAPTDLVAALDLSGSRPIWDFLRRIEGRDATPPVVLIGAPGSGKSTLLQHVALALAAERADLRRAYIPLLLLLREQIAAITAPDPPSLGALAQAHFSALAAYAPVPDGWFEKKLRRGRCLVLLDGLAEISPDRDRGRVAAWIAQQVAAYPRSLFVVTTRPAGYQVTPLAGALVLEIQPFAAPEVQRFVERWHLENEIMRALGHEDEGIQKRAAASARDMMSLLRKRPALSSLARSPLLLTMVATVHGRRGPLSNRRIDLYAEICQVLLGGLGTLGGDGATLREGAIIAALSKLAAHMMHQRVREISDADTRAVVGPALARAGARGVSAERFLRDVESASGLLLEREPGRWAFGHRTFQEYLAAVEARSEGADPPIAALIEDAWWYETLLLYAALGDATPLLETCLAFNSVAALTLAGECLEEAREIAPAVRRRVEQRLSVDAESTDAERRRLTALVWMSRRVSALRAIDGRREIDLTFVTTAEYQLFLDYMRAQGELFHPDHWPHHRFLPGKAAEPMRGVRAEDAARFAHWLSRRRGGSTSYRLPTVEEAKAYPAEEERQGIATWCRNSGRYRLVGLSVDERADLIEQLRPLSSISPPLSLSFNLVRILDLTRDRDLDLDLAIVIALALSHAVVSAEPPTLAKLLSLDRVRDLDLGRRLTLALTRLRDRISSRDLARALAHARARARELDFDRDQIMAVALRPAFELLHDLARNRARATLNQARALQDQITFDRARALAKELDAEELLIALDRKDYLTAHALASVPADPALERTRVMLEDLLTQLRADGPPELLKAQRLSDVRLVEYAWTASAAVSPEESDSEEGPGMARRTMAELSWWIHVILARRSGRLPAWEGIRLVRERPLD